VDSSLGSAILMNSGVSLNSPEVNQSIHWIARLNLSQSDRKVLMSNQWLNDRLIDAINRMVANYIGSDAARSTLLVQISDGSMAAATETVQIIHDSNHWITTACIGGRVLVDWITTACIGGRVLVNWITTACIGGRVLVDWITSACIGGRVLVDWITTACIGGRVLVDWITTACIGGRVLVAESLQRLLSAYVVRQLKQLYSACLDTNGELLVNMVHCQNQHNGYDCGVFAAAFAFVWANGNMDLCCPFVVSRMRQHMVECLENDNIIPFPKVDQSQTNEKLMDMIFFV